MDGGRVVTMSTTRDAVHMRYRAAALQIGQASGCCGDAGCGDPASPQEACGAAYGVDMTGEMLELAERNRQQAGVDNATFLEGTIERVPLPDATVDVVISNCVINLAEDKAAVIREAFRLLRPGGRLAVSDMVELRPLPPAVKQALDQWAGCIAGTIPVADYRQLFLEAGFEAPDIQVTNEQGVA